MTTGLRRRSDSTAHAIAARLETGTLSASVRDSPIRRLRVPFGAQVAHYAIPGKGEPVALVAAAEVLHGGTGLHRRRAPAQKWQDSAWDLRDEVGEFRFTGDRIARAMSQCWLYVADVPEGDDDTPNPVTDGPMYELGRAMFGDRGAGQQAMRMAGQHLQFNGESILLVGQDPETGDMSWSAHSVDELTGVSGNYRVDDGIAPREVTENELVIRCWWPHPRKSGLADAPARSVLPVARELRALMQHNSALIDSRLAGAGILLVPNDIELLPGQAGEPKEGDANSDMDPFVAGLFEAMVTPLQDRDSAAAVVPLVAKVPAEAVDKVRHIVLASQLDPMAKDMRDEAIRRIGLGMESDPGVLLGLGTSGSHWNSWLVAEDEVKMVVGPTCGTVCHAFTAGWLRPAAEQINQDPNKFLVWYSTMPLALRPDKSQDARALYDAGILSEDAAMRENGFNPDEDRPPDDERNRRLLVQLMMTKPDYAAAILAYLGVKLELPEPIQVQPPPPPNQVDSAGDGQSPNDIPPRDTTPPVNDQPTAPPS